MSYAGSIGAHLLKASIAGRLGYKEGQALGQDRKAKAQLAAEERKNEALKLAAELLVKERQANLRDPNDTSVLTERENIQTAGHKQRRAFDAANPIRGEGRSDDGVDRVAMRARAAYKAKLMAPVPQRFGDPTPGMSESEAEELATQAYGPGMSQPANTVTTGAVMRGSILRGGLGAPTDSRTSAATSTPNPKVKSTSAPAYAPKESVRPQPKAATAAAPPAPATRVPPANEKRMAPADLWDKKVDEGMSPEEATAYVRRTLGVG